MPLPHIDAALAQQVEHIHGKDGVSGPNPEGGSRLLKSVGITRYFNRLIFIDLILFYVLGMGSQLYLFVLV